jgi:hypothetical protein
MLKSNKNSLDWTIDDKIHSVHLSTLTNKKFFIFGELVNELDNNKFLILKFCCLKIFQNDLKI